MRKSTDVGLRPQRRGASGHARLDIEPAHLLRLLDDVVRDISSDTIVTCVYAVHDPGDRSLVYATAGHLPPLVTVPGQPARRLSAGGSPWAPVATARSARQSSCPSARR